MTFIVDGTNGLTFNNATTQASAGVVLQVVQGSYSTDSSTTSATFVDTGLTVSITPKFSTSKVLVFVNMTQVNKSGSTNAGMGLNIVRASTQIVQFTDVLGISTVTGNNIVSGSVTYLDSPATTSATTYKVQYLANAGTVRICQDNMPSFITLMEIAG
jgi:hypothetical protein